MENLKIYEFDHKKKYTKTYGEFYESVYTKLAQKYNESVDIITNNVDKVYDSIVRLPENNRNLLVVGKVQSGKTSNLELLSALLYDNDYDVGIIYGGYDNTLLNQTVERFKNTFGDFTNFNIDKPELFILNSIDNSFKDDQKRLFQNKILDGAKILIVTIKNHQTISNLNSFIDNVSQHGKKAFIIDDEGDQATLNTEFKKEKQSSTYKSIVEMKKKLNNPLYLSSTATPYAIIYQPEISELLPETVSLIEPGLEYYGSDEFHLTNDKIIYVDDDENKYNEYLQNALLHFLICCAIRIEDNRYNSAEMIVHVHHTKLVHDELKNKIESERDLFIDSYKSDRDLFELNFKRIYNYKYFSEEIIEKYNFKKLVKNIGETVLRNTYVILQNSDGKSSQENLDDKQFKIFVGGELLQRGVTFQDLVTTYFTRNPKSGNIDTTLQRARWFGYRKNIFDLMRIFTLEEMAEDFTVLTGIENDIWDQFYQVERNELSLKEVYLDVTDTDLNPSRRNVIDIRIDIFGRKWKKQRIGFFDQKIIEENNKIVETFIRDNEFKSISLGRKDDGLNVQIHETNYKNIKGFINDIESVFKHNPLANIFDGVNDNDNIDIITMFVDDNFRRRSFNNKYEITNLHQGLDTVNEERSKYLGDASVINNYDNITIQIFDIVPILEKQNKEEFRQYMFAVYLPKESKIIRRK